MLQVTAQIMGVDLQRVYDFDRGVPKEGATNGKKEEPESDEEGELSDEEIVSEPWQGLFQTSAAVVDRKWVHRVAG
jgi:hypothetical protein